MVHPHGRSNFYVVGEGIYEPGSDQEDGGRPRPLTPIEELRKFRFSRLAPKGKQLSLALLGKLADAMVDPEVEQHDSELPAGFTYLGQFIDHDLTLDKTERALGEDVSVEELVQGRSPALDLDSLYGRGPHKDPQFYSDGVHLKVGTTTGTEFPEDNPRVKAGLRGFDLPRWGFGSFARDRRQPLIADPRNDDNLAVAQTHAAFIRFHNRMVDELALEGLGRQALFEAARAEVVRHYQWVIRSDFLPRILDTDVLDDVFSHGRRYFEVNINAAPSAGDYRPLGAGEQYGSIPVEFTVAAYRMGHSMVRDSYDWNSVFNHSGPGGPATLRLLFNFTGTSGTLSPLPRTEDTALLPEDPNFGSFERLPTNWIADWRRLYDFEADRQPTLGPSAGVNRARRIDTRISDPLRMLPPRSFGGLGGDLPAQLQFNLAFRNLVRARMLSLATGQQVAQLFRLPQLEPRQILLGADGATGVQLHLSAEEESALCENTPLWFYVLREAELKGGRLGPLGSRIVAETFHRAMETSRDSIVRDPFWRPARGPARDRRTFKMVHLLRFAFGDEQLSPI